MNNINNIKKVALCVIFCGSSIFLFKKYRTYFYNLNERKNTETNYKEFKKDNDLENKKEVNKSDVESDVNSELYPKTPPNTPTNIENKSNANFKETLEDPIIIMAI